MGGGNLQSYFQPFRSRSIWTDQPCNVLCRVHHPSFHQSQGRAEGGGLQLFQSDRLSCGHHSPPFGGYHRHPVETVRSEASGDGTMHPLVELPRTFSSFGERTVPTVVGCCSQDLSNDLRRLPAESWKKMPRCVSPSTAPELSMARHRSTRPTPPTRESSPWTWNTTSLSPSSRNCQSYLKAPKTRVGKASTLG